MSQERLSLADILNMYDNSAASQPKESDPEPILEQETESSEVSLAEPELPFAEDRADIEDLPTTATEDVSSDSPELSQTESETETADPIETAPEEFVTEPAPTALPEETETFEEPAEEIEDIAPLSELSTGANDDSPVEAPHTEVPLTTPESYQSFDWSSPAEQIIETEYYQASAEEYLDMENKPKIPTHLVVTAQGQYDLSQPQGVQDLHQEILDVLGEVENIMSRLHNTWNAKDEVRNTYAELEKAAKSDASSNEILKLAEKIAKLGESAKLNPPSRQELSALVMKLEGVKAILGRYIDMFWHC